ncbi:hypothetical protein A3J78_01200 [Candidatus Beckwithbacteria bacterium RBG_13_35_6]|uniref:TraC-like domain-containing protein n=1 Tax=Candidatus Beckwithbacteria bacterium RBG_13_35_6 TaxID=1797456 RepID=A0A1F5DBX2_9BACT|nr:MAG: hypothetical protein A3J78_01200 [Candidatus Beckwithbacteria bacterium RBG_13_35_6]
MPAPPITASTQQHLDIEDIKDDLIILKDGSCCIVMQTNAVNFDLLSEAEQDATIYAYAGLLNSLSFPIQLFITSRKKDISSYLQLLKNQKAKVESEKLKEQIGKYQKFIEQTVKENMVLEKDFYVVIPFSSYELGVSKSVKSSLAGRKKDLPFSKSFIIQKAKTSLMPKRDHIFKQFTRLGLKIKQLNTKELIELLYKIYNPDDVGQFLSSNEDYEVSLVEPNISPSDQQTENKQDTANNTV